MRALLDFPTPIPFLRILALALATLAVLLLSAGALNEAGAADSGGISTSSTDADDGSSTSGGERYTRIWKRTARRDKRWARKTAECESGRDPKAIGGGGMYRGAFQFLKSTWKSSPKSPGGDPIKYPYRTQAVVAVKLKKRDGAGHWPVCGRR